MKFFEDKQKKKGNQENKPLIKSEGTTSKTDSRNKRVDCWNYTVCCLCCCCVPVIGWMIGYNFLVGEALSNVNDPDGDFSNDAEQNFSKANGVQSV